MAEGALEGPQTCMFTEVVSEIAAFLKDTSTVRVSALKVKLYPLCLWVLYSDGLMPLFGYPFKRFMLAPS